MGDMCIERSMLEDDVAEDAEGEDVSSSPVYVTSTGGGGCVGCSVAGSGGRDSAAAWLLALLALAFGLLLSARRKASRAGAGTRARSLVQRPGSLGPPLYCGRACGPPRGLRPRALVDVALLYLPRALRARSRSGSKCTVSYTHLTLPTKRIV